MFSPYGNIRRKVVLVLISTSPTSGQTCIAVVHKAYQNRGAAGTERKYHGKWGSFGGTPGRRCKHPLDAAVSEFYDEAGLRQSHRRELRNLTYHDVVPTRQLHAPHNDILYLLEYRPTQYLDFFVMETHWNLFEIICSGNRDLFRLSHGEIDKIKYVSMRSMLEMQVAELRNYNNNYFLSYFVDTFNRFVLPILRYRDNRFLALWNNIEIPYITDINPRPS